MADLRRRGERRPRSRWPAAPTPPVFGRHRKLVADPLLPATGAKPPVFGRHRKFPVKNGPFGVIFPTEKRGFGICVRQNPRSQLSQAKFHDTKHTVFGRNERACAKNSESGAFNRRGRGEFHSLLPRSTPRGAVRPSLPAPLRSAFPALPYAGPSIRLLRAAPFRLPRAALCGAVRLSLPALRRSASPLCLVWAHSAPCHALGRVLFPATLTVAPHRRASLPRVHRSPRPCCSLGSAVACCHSLSQKIATMSLLSQYIVIIWRHGNLANSYGEGTGRVRLGSGRRGRACQVRFRRKGSLLLAAPRRWRHGKHVPELHEEER